MKALSRARVSWLLLASGLTIALAWWALHAWVGKSAPALCDALAKERIVQVASDAARAPHCPGVRIERVSAPLAQALDADDARALARLLAARKGTAVALTPGTRTRGVGHELARLAFVPGLRAVALAPELAVYAPAREPALSPAEREALAYVARALFRGAREPNLASFPPALRHVERVEVMVMLSRRGEPRLWRSARGTSIARALLTATRVARDRWREREQAMGGPLATRLLELDVEVSLLSEDGTLLDLSRAFVDRAVTPGHGVGFDHRTAWHYVLPADLAKGKGDAYQALTSQIAEQGLPLTILGQSDTRVYRFVSIPLGVSKAPLPESTSQRPN